MHHFHGDPDDLLGKAYDRRVAGRLVRCAAPYRGRVVLTCALMLLAAAGDLALPYLFGLGLDVVNPTLHRVVLGRSGLAALNLLLLAFLVAIAVRFAAYSGQLYLTSWIGQRLVYDLRARLFRHIQRLGIRYIDQRGIGSIMSRIQNDVSVINELFTDGLVGILSDFVILFGIVAIMLLTNWRLALLTFAVMPILVATVIWWRRHAIDAYRMTRIAIARVNANLAESIAGVRVVQAFSRETLNMERFRETNYENLEASLWAARLSAVLFPVVQFAQMLATALVLGVGGHMVLGGSAFTIGELFAFVAYISRFYDPISDLSQRYNTMQAAMVAGERIFGLEDVEPEIQDAPDAVELPRVRGEVVFDHVVFGYGSAPVLHDINLRVRPGESIALVGETGAGKSSIVSLLARFYDVWRGSIRIDGYDIRDVTQRSLRAQLGFVLQDPFLFDGTIRENIAYGRPEATDAEVEAAARAVGAHEFIARLRWGYDTPVHERGATLSVGQRQLISFARAILADPRIIILDEATSSVDTETERLIQEAMRTLLRGRTAFIIAHRLSTIKQVSRIIVLDHGRIVEEGTHDELLARRGVYYDLYALQFRARGAAAAD